MSKENDKAKLWLKQASLTASKKHDQENSNLAGNRADVKCPSTSTINIGIPRKANIQEQT